MVIIIPTNQLTLTLAILILILQSNVLTNSYFPPYPNYSFKSFDPPLRSRKSFITLTRPRRSFGEGREGADKGGSDQQLSAAGASEGRVKGKERNGEREARRGPLLGPAAPWAMAWLCRAVICGAAELGHVTGRCHGDSLAVPPCIAW